MSMWPLMMASVMGGVFSPALARFTLAPPSISARTAARWPSRAAKCNAVSPPTTVAP